MDRHEEHDMDTVPCPACGNDTLRGMAKHYGKCGRCLLSDHRARQAKAGA